MSNGGDFGLTSNSGIKLEAQQQRPGSSSVANSENDEWSDADLGPSTPVHTNSNPNVAVEVIHHHQAFVNTSQFRMNNFIVTHYQHLFKIFVSL